MLKKILILFGFFSLVYMLGGCNLLLTEVDLNKQPKWGNFIRSGEEPSKTDYTNYQYVTITNIQGNVLLNINDPQGDDNGTGELVYPFNYWKGILDMHQVIISADSNYIYFYIALQNKDFGGIEVARNNGGWLFTAVFIFLAKQTNNASNTNIIVYSPNDGTGSGGGTYGLLNPRLFTKDMDVVYGIGVLGSTTPMIGAIWDVSNVLSGPLDSKNKNLTNIFTNDVIRVPLDYNAYLKTGDPSLFSTTVAFRVPRVGALSNSGTWSVIMFTFGWEDYGESYTYPGNNGHLREIFKYPGVYDFGGGDRKEFIPRVADLLTTGNQGQILSNIVTNAGQGFAVINPSDVPSITLP